MGRPKTPTKLKVLRNTTRRDRANPSEPSPKGPLPKRAPLWLSKEARPWWDRVRPLLLEMKVATNADPIAVGLLCDALAEYVAARAEFGEDGLTYTSVFEESERGSDTTRVTVMKRAHPAVGIASDAWRRAKLMLTEFGLTPASRAKVSVANPGPANPLEDWEQKRGSGS